MDIEWVEYEEVPGSDPPPSLRLGVGGLNRADLRNVIVGGRNSMPIGTAYPGSSALTPLLRRTLSLQMHEPLRQRIAVQYHLEGLSREELDAYLAHQFKAAGVTQPLFDDTARQALYQATKGILRKVNKLALTALRLAASRKESTVREAILLDATTEALL